MSWVVGSGERSQVVGVVVGKAWVALGKFLEKFVYLTVEICHQETLPSATPSFPVGKQLCKCLINVAGKKS